jgi:hypothetical protein
MFSHEVADKPKHKRLNIEAVLSAAAAPEKAVLAPLIRIAIHSAYAYI